MFLPIYFPFPASSPLFDFKMTNSPSAPNEAFQSSSRPAKRRILFISLEFNYSPFSGNGVLARSLVSGLVCRNAEGYDIQVRVICARPHPSTNDLSSDIHMGESEHFDNCLEIWPVDLPMGCQWKRLDRHGPWKEFADGCTGSHGNVDCSQSVKDFEPLEVVVVDWHGMLAWEQICNQLKRKNEGDRIRSIKCVYYNFRVYSASLWEHVDADSSSEHTAGETDDFYQNKEQQSCRMAGTIICLSDHDRDHLEVLIKQDTMLESEECLVKLNSISILPPPLRGDILALANREPGELLCHLPEEANAVIQQLSQDMSDKRPPRMFLTCMVRLSPEKSPHHFVPFIQKLGGVEFLRNANLIPLICGAKSVESYAQSVLDDLSTMCGDEWPFVVIDRFLGPEEMASVLLCTSVNLHPCLYDAYGMTVVESTAFGAVSIVNSGGKVGATSLLKEGIGCVGVDLESIILGHGESVAGIVQQIQQHGASLVEVRNNGRSLALGWDEETYCMTLLKILSSAAEY
jgi:glycosyltransferase involved in cell wall biosynthesis